jgi:hypothetical protein
MSVRAFKQAAHCVRQNPGIGAWLVADPSGGPRGGPFDLADHVDDSPLPKRLAPGGLNER